MATIQSVDLGGVNQTWQYDASTIAGFGKHNSDGNTVVKVTSSTAATLTIANWPSFHGTTDHGDARYNDQLDEGGKVAYDLRIAPYIFDGSNLTVVIKSSAQDPPPFPVSFENCNVEVKDIADTTSRGTLKLDKKWDGNSVREFASGKKVVRQAGSDPNGAENTGPFLAIDTGGVGRYPVYVNSADAGAASAGSAQALEVRYNVDGDDSGSTKNLYINADHANFAYRTDSSQVSNPTSVNVNIHNLEGSTTTLTYYYDSSTSAQNPDNKYRYDRVTMNDSGYSAPSGNFPDHMSEITSASNTPLCIFFNCKPVGLGVALNVPETIAYLANSVLTNFEITTTTALNAGGSTLESGPIGSEAATFRVKGSGNSYITPTTITDTDSGGGEVIIDHQKSSGFLRVKLGNNSAAVKVKLINNGSDELSLDGQEKVGPASVDLDRKSSKGSLSVIQTRLPAECHVKVLGDTCILGAGAEASGNVVLSCSNSGKELRWLNRDDGSKMIRGNVTFKDGNGKVLIKNADGGSCTIAGNVKFGTDSNLAAEIDGCILEGNVSVSAGTGQQNLLVKNSRTDGGNVFTYNQSNSSAFLTLDTCHLSAASELVANQGSDKLTVSGSMVNGNTKTTSLKVKANGGDIKLDGISDVDGIVLSSSSNNTITVDDSVLKKVSVDMGSNKDAHALLRGCEVQADSGESAILYKPGYARVVDTSAAGGVSSLNKAEELAQLRMRSSSTNKHRFRALAASGVRFLEVAYNPASPVPARFYAPTGETEVVGSNMAEIGLLVQKWEMIWLDDESGDTAGYAHDGGHYYMPMSTSTLSFNRNGSRGCFTNGFYYGIDSSTDAAAYNADGSLKNSALLSQSEDKLLELINQAMVGQDLWKSQFHLQGWVYRGDSADKYSYQYHRKFFNISSSRKVKALYREDGSRCKRQLQYGLCVGGLDGNETDLNREDGGTTQEGDDGWSFRSLDVQMSLMSSEHYKGKMEINHSTRAVSKSTTSDSNMLPKLQKTIYGDAATGVAASVADFGALNGDSTDRMRLNFTSTEGMEPISLKVEADTGKDATLSGQNLRLFRYWGDTTVRATFHGDANDPDRLYTGGYDSDWKAVSPLILRFVEDNDVTLGVMRKQNGSGSWVDHNDQTDGPLKVKASNADSARIYSSDHYLPMGGSLAVTLPQDSNNRSLDSGNSHDLAYQLKEVQAMKEGEFLASNRRPFLNTFRDNIEPGGYYADFVLVHTGAVQELPLGSATPSKGWKSAQPDVDGNIDATAHEMNVVFQLFPSQRLTETDSNGVEKNKLTVDNRAYEYWPSTSVNTTSTAKVSENYAVAVKSKHGKNLGTDSDYGLVTRLGSAVEVEVNIPNVAHRSYEDDPTVMGIMTGVDGLDGLTSNGIVIPPSGRPDTGTLDDAAFTYDTSNESDDTLKYTVDMMFSIYGLANKDGHVNSGISSIDGVSRADGSGNLNNLIPSQYRDGGASSMARTTSYFDGGNTKVEDIQEFAFVVEPGTAGASEPHQFLTDSSTKWSVALDSSQKSNLNSATKTAENTYDVKQLDLLERNITFANTTKYNGAHPVIVMGGGLQGKFDANHLNFDSVSESDLPQKQKATVVKLTVTMETKRSLCDLSNRELGEVIKGAARLHGLHNLTHVETSLTSIEANCTIPPVVAVGIQADLQSFKPGQESGSVADNTEDAYPKVEQGDTTGTDMLLKAIAKVPAKTTNDPDAVISIAMTTLDSSVTFNFEGLVSSTDKTTSVVDQEFNNPTNNGGETVKQYGVVFNGGRQKVVNIELKSPSSGSNYGSDNTDFLQVDLVKMNERAPNGTDVQSINITDYDGGSGESNYKSGQSFQYVTVGGVGGQASDSGTFKIRPVVDSHRTNVYSITSTTNQTQDAHVLTANTSGTLDTTFTLDANAELLERAPRSLDERLWVGLALQNAIASRNDTDTIVSRNIEFQVVFTDENKLPSDPEIGGPLSNSNNGYANFYDGPTVSATKISSVSYDGNTADKDSAYRVGAWLDLSEMRGFFKILNDSDISLKSNERVVELRAKIKNVEGTTYEVQDSVTDSDGHKHTLFTFARLNLQYAGDIELANISDTPIGVLPLGNMKAIVEPSGDVMFYHDVFVGGDGQTVVDGATAKKDDPSASSYRAQRVGDAMTGAAAGMLRANELSPLLVHLGVSSTNSSFDGVSGASESEVNLRSFRLTGRPNDKPDGESMDADGLETTV